MLRPSRFIDVERNGNGMRDSEEMENGGGGGGYVAPIAAPPLEVIQDGEEPEPVVQTKPIPLYEPPPPKPPIFQPPPEPVAEPEPEPIPEMSIEIAIVEDVPITPEVVELPLPILIPEAIQLRPEIMAEKPPLLIIEPILLVEPKDELSADDLALVSIGRIPDGEQTLADAIHAPVSALTTPVGFEEPPTRAQFAGRGLIWLVLVGVLAVSVLKIFPEP